MLDKLYADIGGKLKGLAKWTFVVEVIASIIAFIALTEDFWIGLAALVGGILVSFVSSWFLYAFGELISRVCSIDDNLRILSVSTHEEMNRNIRDTEEHIRQEAAARAQAKAEEQNRRAEEARAKRKAQWNSVSQATQKTVDLVGEEIAQTASTVVHFVADEYARMESEMSADFVEEERAKRKAEWEAEMQLRREAEERARQVVEERMRRKAEERAQKESSEN